VEEVAVMEEAAEVADIMEQVPAPTII